MKIGKGYIKVFIYIIVLLVFIQLFRMDIIFSTDSIENIIINEFDINHADKLSAAEKKDFVKHKFLIIYKEQNNVLNNIQIILEYLNVEYEISQASEVDKVYSNFNTIIVLDTELNDLIDIDKIMLNTSRGGRLIYLASYKLGEGEVLDKYAPAFGIVNIGENSKTNSVYFNSEILSGIYGELNLDEFDEMDYDEFSYIEFEITNDSLVHMESENDYPLIWSKSYNQGELMIINTGDYEGKEFRGILTGSISLLGEFFLYPIINAEVIFLDDFPADYNSDPEILKDNYGLNTEDFILDIWWPDMIKLITKYNLVYTGVYVETYNDMVNGTFINNEYILSATKQLTSDLLKYNGEITFHGYNHQSLLYNQTYSDFYGYNAWANSGDIIRAINTSTSYFKQVYPNYEFFTYVPPSNLLDNDAIPALLEAIPTISNISGIYYPATDSKGNIKKEVFVQDFSIDNNYGVALPRITAGAFYTNHIRFDMASALTMNGIINHFIHPDDIQDSLRSKGLLWEELYAENDKLFGAINQYYGWLDKAKASDAAEKVKQYINSEVMYFLEDDQITIKVDNLHDEISLILATYKDIVFSKNCEYVKIDSFRYLIKMKENTAVIGVK